MTCSVLTELGQELQRARQERAQSLQAVAEPARISAPYLQKLERGVVDTPSPRVLGRLASVLGLPYLRLMELAGYLDESQLTEVRARSPRPHPLLAEQLSAAEWRAVGDFIRQLKAQRNGPPARARHEKGTRQ